MRILYAIRDILVFRTVFRVISPIIPGIFKSIKILILGLVIFRV